MSPSLSVQIISPLSGRLFAAGSEVLVQALVTLGCGCPSGAGGRFDHRRFQIKGLLSASDHGEEMDFALVPSASAGIFSGRLKVDKGGAWRIAIEVYDPESGMAGRAKVDFKVS
jgi:hypothetical protein